eukprot:m.208641 g.208641  ORF g.208641 m.208641 type:complete len:159 (-) comp15043_c3_seq6:2739-3215(-)
MSTIWGGTYHVKFVLGDMGGVSVVGASLSSHTTTYMGPDFAVDTEITQTLHDVYPAILTCIMCASCTSQFARALASADAASRDWLQRYPLAHALPDDELIKRSVSITSSLDALVAALQHELPRSHHSQVLSLAHVLAQGLDSKIENRPSLKEIITYLS